MRPKQPEHLIVIPKQTDILCSPGTHGDVGHHQHTVQCGQCTSLSARPSQRRQRVEARGHPMWTGQEWASSCTHRSPAASACWRVEASQLSWASRTPPLNGTNRFSSPVLPQIQCGHSQEMMHAVFANKLRSSHRPTLRPSWCSRGCGAYWGCVALHRGSIAQCNRHHPAVSTEK